VARAAIPGRLSWRVATLSASKDETATARTLILDVPGWPGHLPGQHVDVKLTAEDGYSAQRSYSIASAPDGARLELTVQRIADGEVSPYLTEILAPGDPVELRGPIGGWFVWVPADTAPVLLIAGGSGIVPLMSMIRTRANAPIPNTGIPFRLIYSVRSPTDAIYAPELSERSVAPALDVTYLYTRAVPAGVVPPAGPVVPAGPVAPAGWHARTGRISADVIAEAAWPPEASPAIFVCGPSGFVETAAALLVDAGHDPATIKTERFGPTG
jgi:ferredoxin-NADP reductase